MRKISGNVFLVLVLLLSISFLLIGCKSFNKSIPQKWQELLTDKAWIENLNRLLNVGYIEDEYRAGFYPVSDREMLPSIYSTYSIVKMKSYLNENISNSDSIINFINSTRNESGAYLEITNIPESEPVFPTEETRKAITIFKLLGYEPENIDITVEYLLSFQYDDGTFLIKPDMKLTATEKTALARIVNGTYGVVDALLKLGRRDKIPQQTVDIITNEIKAFLAGTGAPSIFNDDGTKIVKAIYLLAEIDPMLVPAEAKRFVEKALVEIIGMDPHTYLFPSRVNTLLDTIDLLGFEGENKETILSGLRSYLKNRIFPLMNCCGGFALSNTIEPLTTSEIVFLAHRLGVIYPNYTKLKAEIDRHQLSNGWTFFNQISIESANPSYTYFALTIAKFTGHNSFNLKKVTSYLRDLLINPPTSMNSRKLYYTVMTLKNVNGNFTRDDINNVKTFCLKLVAELLPLNEAQVKTDIFYIPLVCKELGIPLPGEILSTLSQYAQYVIEDIGNESQNISVELLYLIWMAHNNEALKLTEEVVLEVLGTLYDDIGAYTIRALPNDFADYEAGSVFVQRPFLYSTYLAVRLLDDIGKELPDKNKTITYVLECKYTYGFGRAHDWLLPNLESTYAALMTLKLLSE